MSKSIRRFFYSDLFLVETICDKSTGEASWVFSPQKCWLDKCLLPVFPLFFTGDYPFLFLHEYLSPCQKTPPGLHFPTILFQGVKLMSAFCKYTVPQPSSQSQYYPCRWIRTEVPRKKTSISKIWTFPYIHSTVQPSVLFWTSFTEKLL